MSTDYELTDTPVEDWIDDGVSFLQAKVTIFRNPAIYAEYQPILDQIKSLEKELTPKKPREKQDASLDEESLGGTPAEEALGGDSLTTAMNTRLEELYTEAERLWKQYSDDVEIWTLRRVDEPEVKEVQEGMELPLPVAPAKLKPGASPSQQQAHLRKFEKFIADMKEYTDELNLRCLALGIVKVEVRGQEKPAPSLDGLRRLKKRPGGYGHLRELVAALESLTAEGVNIMAPHRSGAGA